MTHILDSASVIARIRQVRETHSGKRGKALFSKHLGLNPSTYNYYEHNRIPPAEILLKISQLTGVSIEWLLTGHTPDEGDNLIPHGLFRKITQLLRDEPRAAGALEAFVDVLAEKSAMESRLTRQTSNGPAWIPVLGRTAAGVVHFWDARTGKPAGLTELAELVERHRQAPQTSAAAILSPQPPCDLSDDEQVKFIQINTPNDQGVSEFIEAPTLAARYPDAFALRIDGDSMAPTIQPGDLVVLSSSVSARPGQPAVVQLKDQIGVTCKIFRPEDDTVHLIPANTAYSPTDYARTDVLWAYAVLARVRA